MRQVVVIIHIVINVVVDFVATLKIVSCQVSSGGGRSWHRYQWRRQVCGRDEAGAQRGALLSGRGLELGRLEEIVGITIKGMMLSN